MFSTSMEEVRMLMSPDLLANTDAYRTAVLNADFGQSLFAQIIYHKGIVSIFANSLDLLLIAVNGNHLFAGFGKGAGQRRTKRPSPITPNKAEESCFFIMHLSIVMASSVKCALGSGRSTQGKAG